MMDRKELAQLAVDICDAEIESATQGMGDLGGSIAYLAVTATFVALTEVFKNVSCQEVHAGSSYVSCLGAAWLKGKPQEWCQICQMKHELLDMKEAQTRLLMRLPRRPE